MTHADLLADLKFRFNLLKDVAHPEAEAMKFVLAFEAAGLLERPAPTTSMQQMATILLGNFVGITIQGGDRYLGQICQHGAERLAESLLTNGYQIVRKL